EKAATITKRLSDVFETIGGEEGVKEDDFDVDEDNFEDVDEGSDKETEAELANVDQDNEELDADDDNVDADSMSEADEETDAPVPQSSTPRLAKRRMATMTR